LVAEVFDLPVRCLPLLAVHLRGCRARESPLGTVDDGRGYLQIA
jgi:hypothetical protein